MSEQNSENNYKEAKANAKAEKARAKAMRPWFKKKRFIVPIAIAALVIVSTAANSGNKGDSSAKSNTDSGSTSETAKVATIGDTVTDGDFTFKVSKQKCGLSKVGSGYASAKAKGEFCVYTVSVTNNGNDANFFFGSNQKLINAEGQEYSDDSMAELYAGSSDTWISEINPGITATGVLVFDVPVGSVLDHLELHDTAFSSGVDVSVK